MGVEQPDVSSPEIGGLAERYAAAFAAHLGEGGESGLGAAYALGREAVAEQYSVLDFADAHHRALTAALIANEPGLRANLDSEFLHDFRVALRRTRSLLGQLKHVFPENVVAHFGAEFSWMGRLTGPPRDLDVLVLSLRDQPEDVDAGGFQALLAFLGQMQEREHRSLVEALDSQSEGAATAPPASKWGRPLYGASSTRRRRHASWR